MKIFRKLLSAALCLMLVVCSAATGSFSASAAGEDYQVIIARASGVTEDLLFDSLSGTEYEAGLISSACGMGKTPEEMFDSVFPASGLNSHIPGTFLGGLTETDAARIVSNLKNAGFNDAFACSECCGGNVRWSIAGGTLTISGSGPMDDYTDDYPVWLDFTDLFSQAVIENGVTTIGKKAFEECYDLTGVDIPSSVTSIGEEAFEDCESIASITIPASVTAVGKGAFKGCSSLTEIKADSAGNCFCTVNGVLFSKDMKTLVRYPEGKQETSYEIPDSVKSIGDEAFFGCKSLMSITIPSSVTSIGDVAFCGCASLINTGIPSSVTSIGEGAFCGCASLKNIGIPSSVTSIGAQAFVLCKSLESVTLPSSLTSIADGLFMYCSSLTSVTIPSSVTSIGVGAFLGCRALRDITVPSSVTEIGEDAFVSCPDDLVITCAQGSAADIYADEHGGNVSYIAGNAAAAAYTLPDFSGKPAAYKTDITVSFALANLPAGAEVFIDGGKADTDNGRYEKHIGQVDSDRTVRVEVRKDGAVISEKQARVTVDKGFIARIAAFFTNFLFNGFRWKTGTVNF